MRFELAEQLLHRLMGWQTTEDFLQVTQSLQRMAKYKYDSYENFYPGVRFLERLSSWLAQFGSLDEREVALSFIRERLIYISDAELSCLIDLVYPTNIEPVLRDRVADTTGIAPYAVRRIIDSPEFVSLRRRSLIVGASDGARVDRLRRSSPTLSHEQFCPAVELQENMLKRMNKSLEKALNDQTLPGPYTFAHVFVIDDFAGSGDSLLRSGKRGLGGKLVTLRDQLNWLVDEDIVADNHRVDIVLYIASESAIGQISSLLEQHYSSAWRVSAVQVLPNSIKLQESDPSFCALNEHYYDEAITDSHKGRAPLGYSDSGLPVVLEHNCPNNSVSLLWAETHERRALFPRYERHHRDRP